MQMSEDPVVAGVGSEGVSNITTVHRFAVAAINSLQRPTLLVGVALIVCTAALLVTANRVRPFVDDVTEATASGDDWLTYKQNALDILDHGLAMPSTHEAYYQPSGFFYNYFIAAIFALAGRIPAYVYAVQGSLLVLTVVLYYLLGSSVLSPEMALVYPMLVAGLLYRTVYRDLTVRLLSENLAIPLIAAAALLFVLASRRPSPLRFAAVGLMVGLVIVTRPHMVAVAFLLGIVVWLFTSESTVRKAGNGATLMVVAVGVLSSIAVRNCAVTGQFTLASAHHASLLPGPAEYGGVLGLIQLFSKRALYCAGILIGGLMMSGTKVSVSVWLAVPTVVAAVEIARCVRQRYMPLVDAVALAWLVAAYVPFIMLPLLGGYGMRFQWPTAPLLVLLACKAVDPLLTADTVRRPRRIT